MKLFVRYKSIRIQTRGLIFQAQKVKMIFMTSTFYGRINTQWSVNCAKTKVSLNKFILILIQARTLSTIGSEFFQSEVSCAFLYTKYAFIFLQCMMCPREKISLLHADNLTYSDKTNSEK